MLPKTIFWRQISALAKMGLGGRKPRQRTNPLRVRLGLEKLEDRLMPSVSVFTVNATTDTGTGSGTAGDLRYCINAAITAGGTDTINFSPTVFASPQTINLNSALGTGTNSLYGATAFEITGSVNLTINGSSAGVTINGQSTERLFAVTSTAALTLNNLTLENGEAKGGAGGNGDRGGGGGGAAGLGGAVFDDGGSVTAVGCLFTNNTAQGGAGGAGGGGGGAGGGGGGGIGVAGSSSTNGVGGSGGNSANTGSFGSGGSGGTEEEEEEALANGKNGGFGAGGGGGGETVGEEFGGSGGSGGFGGGSGGGGGYLDGDLGGSGGTVIGGLSTVFNNHGGAGSNSSNGFGGGGGGGAGFGGAIFNNQGNVTLTNDTFTADSAIGGAGGAASGALHGTAGTAGPGNGGALFNRNGTLNVTFVTFSGNTAAQGGTDVYVLDDSSKSNDTSTTGNGTGSGTDTLIDSILGQTAKLVTDFVAATGSTANSITPTAPALAASSYDLVRDNQGTASPLSGLPSAAIVSSADPLLFGLADNGGPTDTMALESNSPALGTGLPESGITTVDQRGLTRALPVDLGAWEAYVSQSSSRRAIFFNVP